MTWGFPRGTQGDGGAVALAGFEKVATFDFQSMTPTDMNTVSTWAVDGVDFIVGGISGTSIKIDSAGIYPVGGTGASWVSIDLSTVLGGLDLSGERLLAFTVDTNDVAHEWDVSIGQDGNNRFGGGKQSAGVMWVWRRIAGAFLNAANSLTAKETHAFIRHAGAVSHAYEAAALGLDTDPLSCSSPGDSAAKDGFGYAPFSGAGGIAHFYFNGSGARNVRIRSVTIWRVPVPA